MGPAAVPILQIVCLVCVAIAIVNVRKVQRNINEITKNMEEGLWEYTKVVRLEMEARLKKIEDAVALLQKRKEG